MPSRNRFQYQAKTQPTATIVNPTQARWFVPWSEPVKQAIAPAMAVALITASGYIAPPPVQPNAPIAASQNNNADIQAQPQFQYQVQTKPVPPVEGLSVDKWFEAWTDPVRVLPRTVWYQPDTFGRAAPFPETVTESRWHQPWSEPVRVNPRDAWFQADVLTRTASDVTGIQYLALSEPVRTAPRDAWFQPDTFGRAAPFPETVTESRWHQAWSEPVRVAPRTAQFSDLAWNTIFSTSTITTNWFSPLSEPVRVNYLRAEQQQGFFWSTTTPAPVVVTATSVPDDINVPYTFSFQYQAAAAPVTTAVPAPAQTYPPWSDPPRAAARDAWYQPDAFGRAAPFPETVTESRWHQPWSEPVRVKPRAAQFSDLAWSTFTPAVSAITTNWFSPLSEPVRVKPRVAAVMDTAWVFAPIPPFVAEATGSDVIFRTRLIYQSRTQLSTTPAPVVAIGITTPNVGVSYEARVQYQALATPVLPQPLAAPAQTYPPLANPVLPKNILTAQQQFLALDPFPRQNAVVSTLRYLPLSEPVRVPLRTAEYQAFIGTLIPPPLVPEATSGDVYFEQSIIYSDSAFVELVPATLKAAVAIGPDVSVSYETRFQYQVIANPLVQTSAEVITVSKWFTPWQDPVRTAPRLLDAAQRALALAPNPVPPLFGYFQPLATPVALPARLRAGAEFEPFTPVIPVTPASFRGWYNWLSEPVRLPLGLKAYLQSTTAMPTEIIVITTTGTMAAIELGDVFSAAGFEYNQVASAEVGIETQKPSAGATGVITNG